MKPTDSKLFLQALTDKEDLDTLFAMMDTDFPPGARIPLGMLRGAINKSVATAVFLTDGNTAYGYALYQKAPQLGLLHILYLAILPHHRAEGLGSVLMRQIIQSAPGGIILDVENPAAANNAAEQAVRNKRIAFYQNNGFAVFPHFRFRNAGYDMLVMANIPLPQSIHWLDFYRTLHNQIYGWPIARLLIRPAKKD